MTKNELEAFIKEHKAVPYLNAEALVPAKELKDGKAEILGLEIDGGIELLPVIDPKVIKYAKELKGDKFEIKGLDAPPEGEMGQVYDPKPATSVKLVPKK